MLGLGAGRPGVHTCGVQAVWGGFAGRPAGAPPSQGSSLCWRGCLPSPIQRVARLHGAKMAPLPECLPVTAECWQWQPPRAQEDAVSLPHPPACSYQLLSLSS